MILSNMTWKIKKYNGIGYKCLALLAKVGRGEGGTTKKQIG